jgi:two-component system, chemotaxis family, chemotaxis protein CheY
MILIDTHADIKLAEALEVLRAEPNATRCIYFSLMDKPAISGITEKIIASASQHIGSSDLKIYLCEDADICILAPTINSKDGKQFILDVAAYANMPATGDWVGFYEVSLQINKLLVTVEHKLETRRKAEQAKQKLLEQQQQERKRQLILNGGEKNTSEDIKKRRANRNAPEFMIIEDDTFTRRLVENVLQKKYAMTSLGEADKALDTYTRLAPDLLFLDINLPDVTGHELLEKILALDPDAYVIMLSGNCDRENITQAMSKGARGFIAKPFTREKLFQYIDRCPTIKQA